jgi:hypothetical protein
VVVDEGFGYAVVMVVVGVVGWWLMVDLAKYSFLPLLSLTENIEGVLHLYEPRSLPIDILPASFSALDCSLPSPDGLLLLPELLNFLLDSCNPFLLYCCFLFLGFFIPITDLDLIELYVSWKHVYW